MENQPQNQQHDPEKCTDCETVPTSKSTTTHSSTVVGSPPSSATTPSDIKYPRIAITFCTQCKWMLRAAYFGQELLSTFGAGIGEIALIPATGGLFQVNVTYLEQRAVAAADQAAELESKGNDVAVKEVLLWDRKAKGGFPETKVLKQLVRDVIEPGKGLGHSDAPGKSQAKGKGTETEVTAHGGKKDAVQDASPLSPAVANTTSNASTAEARSGGDGSSSIDNIASTKPATSLSPSITDPLLQEAKATPTISTRLSSITITPPTLANSLDPLLETAISSPILSPREREDSQPMSPSTRDAFAKEDAPTTWEDEGIKP